MTGRSPNLLKFVLALAVILSLFSVPINAMDCEKVAQYVKPSLALVYRGSAKKPDPYGTGFAISSKGHILTCAHVVMGLDGKPVSTSKEPVWVRLSDGRRLKSRIIFFDPYHDLALIRVNVRGIPFLKFEKELAPLDTEVMVFGYSKNSAQAVFSSGIVRHTWKLGVLGTTATVNPGDSGGPMVNGSGHVVGVVALKILEEDLQFASAAVASTAVARMLLEFQINIPGLYSHVPAETSAAYGKLKKQLAAISGLKDKKSEEKRISLLQQSLDIEENSEIRDKLIAALIKLGRRADAIQAAKDGVIDYEPEDSNGPRRLAETYANLSMPKEALETFEAAIKAQPKSYLLHQGLGEFYENSMRKTNNSQRLSRSTY